METVPSLETMILQNLRQKEEHGAVLNQYHRRFLNLPRDANWIASTKLPDTPTTALALLRSGRIKRRSTKEGVEYRMTKVGLSELNRRR
jgi:hypothetical protein